MKLRVPLLLALLAIPACQALAQLSQVGLGWAKNAVNAPVFRKNAVVSFNGTQYTAYYDSTAHLVVAKRKLRSNHWEIRQTKYTGKVSDAHNSISIMVDGDGYLHVAWDHHNNQLRYCKSLSPNSLDMSELSPMVGAQENDVTYPEFFKLPNGDLLFMYRYGISGNGNLIINKYSIQEKAWKRLHDVLIDGEGERNAYWQACVDARGTIHISWVWRETWDVSTNHDLCYAKSTDGGLTWQNSKGAAYKLPITAATAEYVSTIPQKSELINQTSMCADSKGNAYIASYWKPQGEQVPQYHLVYYCSDSARWITKQASNRQTAFSLSGGGTKKIPISRPQILLKENKGKPATVYLVYRDVERNSKVSLNISKDASHSQWETFDLTDFSVNSWEPSYDTELWKQSATLSLFVQNMGQGDGEHLESLPAQPVYILSLPAKLKAKSKGSFTTK